MVIVNPFVRLCTAMCAEGGHMWQMVIYEASNPLLGGAEEVGYPFSKVRGVAIETFEFFFGQDDL